MLAPSASTELTPTTIEHALTTSTEAIVRPLDIAKLARLVGASEAEVIVALCSNTQETGRPRASSSVVSDAEQPEQQRSSRPKTARVALVTAARRKPTRRASGAGIPDAVPKELLQVGGAALICHSLEALRRAGFRRCVVLVAYRGSEIAEHVGRHFGNKLGDDFGIEFLDLGDDWDGFHGKSILAARDTVARCTDGLETPLLLVTSDHLFDASLLRSVARSTDRNRIGDDNALLVEDLGGNAEELLRALPPTAVKVAKKDGSYCARVGRELPAGVKQDGVDAGLARIEGPRLWDALEDLDASSDYYTLADALDHVALSDACSTKAARSGGISAPALHAAMQVGCWLLSVLVFVFVEGGEFIETLAFFESPLTYLWLALVVDTAGTFFYTLAASLVDPLLVTVAALLQPLCVVIFQSTLFGSPPPGPAYLLAAACLVSGGTVVATSKAETKETVNIDAAVGVRVRCDSIRDSVDSAFSPQQSAKSRKFWRNSGEEATPLV